MIVYCITFPDYSQYIGCTKNTIKNRVVNHISKCKSGKYSRRPLYKKMIEYNYDLTYSCLYTSNFDEDCYNKEESLIALINNNLNQSSGGKWSSKGVKRDAEWTRKRVDKLYSDCPYIRTIRKEDGKEITTNKQKEAARFFNCSIANISYLWKNLSASKPNYESKHYKISVEHGGGLFH